MPRGDHLNTQGNPSAENSQGAWRARLELAFFADERQAATNSTEPAGRTRFARKVGYGPLYVQKPFYPEGAPCHVYLLHPPGGVVGGDKLNVEMTVGRDAHALITTPAATKFYRSAGPWAEQCSTLHVAPTGVLEWLPQASLLFSGCRVRLRTRVFLAPGSRYIGWEFCCLGRPAAQEMFSAGVLDQHIEVYRRETAAAKPLPMFLERNHWAGNDALLRARWGLSGATTVGLLCATPLDAEMTATLRTTMAETQFSADVSSSISLLNGVLTARVLAAGAEPAHRWLSHIWQLLRPMLLDRPACTPAVWQT